MPPSRPATPKIVCNHVWKIFGPQPQHTVEAVKPEASRDEILAQTGHLVAVRDVSFQVGAGETFVVMGLSGSGKSTLLRCLPRLVEPTRGQVLIDGEDVTALDETRLRNLRRHNLSMVFQNFGLFPHRRVLDNVAYGLEIQGVNKDKRYKRAREVIELVNLKGMVPP
jgi:glycine betaine/proline transport system ATP-binding protein